MTSGPLRLPELSDRELVCLFQEGERKAYEELYKRHRGRVAYVCSRMLNDRRDVEEAVQETFVKAYQALPRFNGRYHVGAWLARIASNVCFDQLRARTRSSEVIYLASDQEIPDDGVRPEEVVLGGDVRLEEAIGDIQPLHAHALRLRVIDGMSHKEIAGHLAMTPEQVKALLHRARTSLRRAWDRAEGWALAPLIGLRSLMSRSRNTSDAGTHLLPAGQTFSPLLAERVAASAIILAVALTGAPSSPSPDDRVPQVGKERSAHAGARDRGDAKEAETLRTKQVASTTVADASTTQTQASDQLAALNETVDEVVKDSTPEPPKKPRKNPGGLPGFNPSSTKPVVKSVRDAVERLTEK